MHSVECSATGPTRDGEGVDGEDECERREREERERESTGYEPFALHAPMQWAI